MKDFVVECEYRLL